MSNATKADPRQRRLPAQMVTANAAACHALFQEWFAADDADLLLCGDEVCQIDTAGVQLLLSAVILARVRGRRMRLISCSPALHEALVFAGLGEKFVARGGGSS